jgi:spore maturation protein CgeB
MREENLRVLAERAPGLAERIAAAPVPSGYALADGDGRPTLLVDGTPLHHPQHPEADAARWARGALDRIAAARAGAVVVVGLGLGYHIEALAERFDGPITVVEPDLAVWRLALSARDLSATLGRVTVVAGDNGTQVAGAATLVLGYAPSLLIPSGLHRRALERWRASAARTGLRLKVLVVSPLYGGSWPIAGYAARALAELGHEAHLLDLAGFHDGFRGLERFGARKRRRGELEAQYVEMMASGVAAAVEAAEPDIVLALAQAPLTASVLDDIGARGVLRVLWFVEDFRVMPYWREVVPHYDYVCTIQEDECLAAMTAETDARVAYLPCGFDPEIHRPLVLDPEERSRYGSDVSFVGAGYWNRRLAFRRFLDADFKIWGSDWGGAGELAHVLQRGGARIQTEEGVRIFNASRVNLNLHSSTYHDGVDPRGDFVNPRTFELAGCGAFQVVDARRLLPPLFGAGTELAVAHSVGEMRELTDFYLAHPDERADMAVRARIRALAEHTYAHRMESLLGMVMGAAHEDLLGRARAVTVGDVARSGDDALARFLTRVDPATPFSLHALAASLAEREGPLAEPEAILLFLHQFDELYLREHRA